MTVRAARAWAWREHGLPVPGGYLDQSASWIAFVDVLERERAQIREEEQRAQESAARAKAKARGR